MIQEQHMNHQVHQGHQVSQNIKKIIFGLKQGYGFRSQVFLVDLVPLVVNSFLEVGS